MSFDRNAYQRQWRKQNRERGLCSHCSAPVAAGKTVCQRHLDARRWFKSYAAKTPEQKAAAIAYQIQRAGLRKAIGLCTVCGEPAAPGCTGACERHRAIRNQRTFAYRKRRAAVDPAYVERERQRLAANARRRAARARDGFT